jgi:O-antigen/teichoic acid export membrane protein
LQLSKHIGKAAWSTADKMLYVFIGLAFVLPQKVIGESNWGIYITAQAMLTAIYMLSDGLALQAMVNYGMEASHRRQALTVSAIMHLLFILSCTTLVYFGRSTIASIFNEQGLVPVLRLFPLVSLGFLLRNYFLKVSQLHIDTRATFIIDIVWIGATVGLILYEWGTGILVTAEDMMLISAISSGASSLAGLILYAGKVRLTTKLDRGYAQTMFRFGLAQFFSAATIALQTQGDVLILKRFVDSGMVGNYDTAKKFFRGFEALRDAGALFVYPAVAKLKSQGRDEEMVRLVEKMIGFMLIVVLPIVALVWLGPTDYLFALIYKGKYQQAPFIFKLLSLAALAIPFSMNMNVLNGLGEARRFFRVTVSAALIFFISALLLVPRLGVVGSALTIIISYAALGVFATRAVSNRVPFSLRGAFGRWRDAVDFILRMWRRGGGKRLKLNLRSRVRRVRTRVREKE